MAANATAAVAGKNASAPSVIIAASATWTVVPLAVLLNSSNRSTLAPVAMSTRDTHTELVASIDHSSTVKQQQQPQYLAPNQFNRGKKKKMCWLIVRRRIINKKKERKKREEKTKKYDVSLRDGPVAVSQTKDRSEMFSLYCFFLL